MYCWLVFFLIDSGSCSYIPCYDKGCPAVCLSAYTGLFSCMHRLKQYFWSTHCCFLIQILTGFHCSFVLHYAEQSICQLKHNHGAQGRVQFSLISSPTDFVHLFCAALFISSHDTVVLNFQKHFLWSPRPAADGFYCYDCFKPEEQSQASNLKEALSCFWNKSHLLNATILYCRLSIHRYPQESKAKKIYIYFNWGRCKERNSCSSSARGMHVTQNQSYDTKLQEEKVVTYKAFSMIHDTIGHKAVVREALSNSTVGCFFLNYLCRTETCKACDFEKAAVSLSAVYADLRAATPGTCLNHLMTIFAAL